MRRRCFRGTYQVKDHSDHETAARADSNILLIQQVFECDLKLVAARTRELVNSHGLIKDHILDLDLVVDRNTLVVRHFGASFLVVKFLGWPKSHEQKRLPRECDQKSKIHSSPRGKWRACNCPNVADPFLWRSQMLITCRMLRESVGRLAPAPDSSAEEAYVWGSCLRYDGAHKTFLGHVAQQSYIHQHVFFLFLLKHQLETFYLHY